MCFISSSISCEMFFRQMNVCMAQSVGVCYVRLIIHMHTHNHNAHTSRCLPCSHAIFIVAIFMFIQICLQYSLVAHRDHATEGQRWPSPTWQRWPSPRCSIFQWATRAREERAREERAASEGQRWPSAREERAREITWAFSAWPGPGPGFCSFLEVRGFPAAGTRRGRTWCLRGG